MSAPRISVAMVTHGAWEWTERALTALAEATAEPYEVIVVDNASPDDTVAQLRTGFPDVRIIENAENAGFGAATNQAAAQAQAPLLLLLNPDAIVQPGWLEPLLAELKDPRVAAAAPMLLNLDGTVQDAGAVVARDGTVACLGDGGDPDDPILRFPRTVDFASGACLLVKRDAYEAAGGLDPVYAPAYYEDADLCMALAAEGLLTRYAPASKVVHARYRSGSPERAVALSAANRPTFVARWKQRLTGRPESLAQPTPETVLCARDAPASGRVLVAASTIPAVLAELLSRRPELRLTLLLERHDAVAEAWLAAGAEVAWPAGAERASWLEARRGQYDLLLGEPDADVLATQPQAGRAPLPARSQDLAHALAAGGLSP